MGLGAGTRTIKCRRALAASLQILSAAAVLIERWAVKKRIRPAVSRGPCSSRFRFVGLRGPRSLAVRGQVHLDIGEVDVTLFHLALGVRHLLPIDTTAVGQAWEVFHLALAIHTGRAVGQRIQTRHGYLGLAVFAKAVGALLHTSNRPLDLA